MAEPIDFDPINNPIHALRLEFGDIDEYDYILSDESYQYFINKYALTSPTVISRSIGNAILAKLAKDGFRQRVGQEEAFLSERYKNYLDWIKQKVSNPLLSGVVPAVYVGGVFRDVVEYYENHPNLVDSMFYRGQHSGIPYWLSKRITTPFGVKEYSDYPINHIIE